MPNEEAVDEVLAGGAVSLAVDDRRWKAGVPRDSGASWDFEDVRDHYLDLLFGLDPAAVRSADPARYLELSRAVSGEVMAETLGEWRRPGSPTRGALVLSLRDLLPGAGWGLLDHAGAPKVAWHHVRRALAPVAVWTTDEGLNGVDVHAANDRGGPFRGRLRVALYADRERLVEEVAVDVDLSAHAVSTYNVEALLGRFVDVSYAYRFGPPGHDVLVASLEQDDGPVSQAFRFPAGRPLELETADELGLEAGAEPAEGGATLVVRTRRLAYGVRVHGLDLAASDDAFSVEPGQERRIVLRPIAGRALPGVAFLTALNLDGRVRAPLPEGGT